MAPRYPIPLCRRLLAGAVTASLLAAGGPVAAQAQQQPEGMPEQVKRLQRMNPQRGYLEAHKGVQDPLPLLGGPIEVTVTQDVGGAHVALPDHRRLDEVVFGTPDMPRAYGGTPVITGVPPAMRGVEGGEFTTLQRKSPFGHANIVAGEGRLRLQAVDATATDAATTEDQVQMEANWRDEAGDTYAVRCCEQLAAHGVEYPTFGGVVTNHILHGFSGVGTPLMPSEFTYVAFWGMGEVLKNGEVVDKPRLVHGMLTEYVRTEDYQLGFDRDVTPTRRHFHVMVPPMMPVPEEGRFEPNPVRTGFTLPNGEELPFWHVMFDTLDIGAERRS